MEINSEKFIVDYLGGDDAAFSALVGLYLPSVHNFIFRLVGNAADAEDISQEAFFKAWKNIKKYRHGESFKAWLFGIARNAAIDRLRRKKDFVFSDFENADGDNILTETLSDPAALPSEVVEQIEIRELLNEMLSKLTPAHREVLLLHYGEHFTFNEIGQSLGEPLHTVKSRHRRALLALRELAINPLLKSGFMADQDNAPEYGFDSYY